MRLIFFVVAVFAGSAATAGAQDWTAAEKRTLRSLWVDSAEKLSPDPSNRYADNPRAVALGHRLFFDTRLSSNGAVSCATCHQPDRAFTDGQVLAKGVGRAGRHAPTLVGAAYSPWFFWDGRKDSQWSQALGPLEAAVEHGGTRTQYMKLILTDPVYRVAYASVFDGVPSDIDISRIPDRAMPNGDAAARAAWNRMPEADRNAVSQIYANIGKAIAAYERLIVPGPSRFDHYVAAIMKADKADDVPQFTREEIEGLRTFIGRGNCTQCHNGPFLTNNEFHNTGLPEAHGAPRDVGRAEGVQQLFRDEFNCASRFSNAGPDDCGELKFAKSEGAELAGAFKTPTLRNVAETPPYMHNGRFATLNSVLEHYNEAPAAAVGHSELTPLHLTKTEIRQLELFLRTLSGPLLTPQKYLTAPP
jgi:cytochrome c peroxidase